MPVYEYACAACGHEFEEWQKITDEPVKICPKCKKRKVERLISKTSFQLKGGGWYSDLYSSSKSGGDKSDSSEKGDKTDSGAKSEPKADAGGKAERKPAKAESKPGKPDKKADKKAKA